MNQRIVFILLIAVMFTAVPMMTFGSVSLTTVGNPPYTESFDTLASAGTSSTMPTGWEFLEGGTNANTTYTAGNGSSNTGDTYSFGAAASSERAFGTLRSNALNPIFGVSLTNNTSCAISMLSVLYVGEQWRLGYMGRTDRLDFQYSIDATSLSDGNWSDVNDLDFSTMNESSTVGNKDGNTDEWRQTKTFSITGLNIMPGATFWIRWQDFDAINADDGLAIDQFSLLALAAPIVTTQAVTGINPTTATGNGDITHLGGIAATAHGVVWNTIGTPTLADNSTNEGLAAATGAFTSSMTGLSPETTYYVRAYATNAAGTAYGDEITFTTAAASTIPTLSEWGTIIFALLMTGTAIAFLRKRKGIPV